MSFPHNCFNHSIRQPILPNLIPKEKNITNFVAIFFIHLFKSIKVVIVILAKLCVDSYFQGNNAQCFLAQKKMWLLPHPIFLV